MRILAIDRDEMVLQMVKSKLEGEGHIVFTEQAKNNAVDRLAKEEFDVILLDPTPLTSPRPVILNIRRATKNNPYILLLSESVSLEEAVKAGSNDLLEKPIDPVAFEQKIDNARYFSDLVQRIGDDSEDFPSAGGVIAKSAFNQLFLSAIDRADRYGEQTYILFISLRNYKEILELDGPYAAEYASAKLSQYLVRLRRQSDIIGQTAKHEYALLLQRPLYQTEPVEAANRFAEALGKFDRLKNEGGSIIEVALRLVEVPTGRIIAQRDITPANTVEV